MEIFNQFRRAAFCFLFTGFVLTYSTIAGAQTDAVQLLNAFGEPGY